MVFRRFVAAALLFFAVSPAVAPAERPIVDLHKLDAYFALFAGDSSVPWKPTSIRLDTYSSAPAASREAMVRTTLEFFWPIAT